MPVLHIDHKSGVSFHAGVAPFEPMVEPSHGLVAPLHLRPKVWFIRKGVIPGADDRFDRRCGLHKHVGNVIAVTVLQAPNQKTGNRDLAQRTHALPPEWPIVLVREIK